MRVAVVSGPDPGHAFPAVALCLRLRDAGHAPLLWTGSRWMGRLPLPTAELPGLAAAPGEADLDAGARLHRRAARMAPALAAAFDADPPDLVVADTLTVAGGLAAELRGLPWVELVPHPLHLASVALPPPGSGLAPGRGPLGRARDALLRRMHARSVRLGRGQRAAARASLGLPADDPGPVRRLVATLPALEPERPDWPDHTDVVGPLHWDPADPDPDPADPDPTGGDPGGPGSGSPGVAGSAAAGRALPGGEVVAPAGEAPLVLVSPSTAVDGREGLLAAALAALTPLGERGAVRLVATLLDPPQPGADLPGWAAVGRGRQAPLLARTRVVVAGGGHGMLTKALAAGMPLVLVPGGGDQRDLARRAARLGAAVTVERAATPRRLAAAVTQILADPAYAAAARTAARSGDAVADPVRLCVQAVIRE